MRSPRGLVATIILRKRYGQLLINTENKVTSLKKYSEPSCNADYSSNTSKCTIEIHPCFFLRVCVWVCVDEVSGWLKVWRIKKLLTLMKFLLDSSSNVMSTIMKYYHNYFNWWLLICLKYLFKKSILCILLIINFLYMLLINYKVIFVWFFYI